MRRSVALLLSMGAVFLLGWQARAWGQKIPDVTQYTRETYLEWYNKYKDAKPEFKPGDVLTHADLEKVRPFLLPGYFEQYQKWADLKMEIAEPLHLEHHPQFEECNEKYQAQVRLAEDGALENYVCGQPFAIGDIKPEDPASALKIAWNYDKSWWWRGLYTINALATWIRFGGSHAGQAPEIERPPRGWIGEVKIKPEEWQYDTEKIYGGGGRFERSLAAFYMRATHSHLPMFPESNYLLPGSSEAGEVFWKEFTGFFSPYDVRGTAFIIKRYEDPRRTDDGWAYVPAIRRVRRISAEVKSDSLMGTEHTLEDFYGFNGRVLEWDWKFWGWKDMLMAGLGRSKWYDGEQRYGGPDGWLTDDVWQLRKAAIVERIPRDPRHPYKSNIMVIDAETWTAAGGTVAFDRKGNLWKIWQMKYWWTEASKRFVDINHGRQAMVWRTIDTVDIQNGRGNVWCGYGIGLPDFSPDYIDRLFDLNRLTELHR